MFKGIRLVLQIPGRNRGGGRQWERVREDVDEEEILAVRP